MGFVCLMANKAGICSSDIVYLGSSISEMISLVYDGGHTVYPTLSFLSLRFEKKKKKNLCMMTYCINENRLDLEIQSAQACQGRR